MAAMEVSGLRINLFSSEKKIRNTRICCFSLSFKIVNEILWAWDCWLDKIVTFKASI